MKISSNMRKIIILTIFVIALFAGEYVKKHNPPSQSNVPGNAFNQGSVLAAYNSQQSDIQVQDSGTVVKILPDDLKGSRHQKFIVRISQDLTVLIAHNIDLAPRVDKLSVGNSIGFSGEYEWNAKGGVVHWTHHDPHNRHQDGWLEYKGRFYK